MKKTNKILTLLLLAATMLGACTSDSDTMGGVQKGTGSFALQVKPADIDVEVTSRAPENSTADYLITLNDEDETIWSKRIFSSLTHADCTQPIGSGYVLSAESCSEEEAESSNDGWGKRRYTGSSTPFTLKKDETTEVAIECAMSNAGFCVIFDKSFTDLFSTYSVTTDDARFLRFNGDNEAHLNAEGKVVSGSIAYYNTTEDNTHLLHVIISGSAGFDGTARVTKSITLQSGKITRLTVKVGNDPEEQKGYISDLIITYDDLEEVNTSLTVDDNGEVVE